MGGRRLDARQDLPFALVSSTSWCVIARQLLLIDNKRNTQEHPNCQPLWTVWIFAQGTRLPMSSVLSS